jgi:hypothetical protein
MELGASASESTKHDTKDDNVGIQLCLWGARKGKQEGANTDIKDVNGDTTKRNPKARA